MKVTVQNFNEKSKRKDDDQPGGMTRGQLEERKAELEKRLETQLEELKNPLWQGLALLFGMVSTYLFLQLSRWCCRSKKIQTAKQRKMMEQEREILRKEAKAVEKLEAQVKKLETK